VRATLAIVAGTVALALLGFGIGHITASSASDARDARDSAKAAAAKASKATAYAKGRERGLSAGKKKGREDGDAAGERKGLADGQEAVANGTAGGTTTDQTGGTTSGGSTSGGTTSGGSTSGTPSVDSQQGQDIIQGSPECKDHPPPPDYHGPVQC
jgi:hypothetical protein